MTDGHGLLHFRVERGLFNAAARDQHHHYCPVCGIAGRWIADCFVCDRDTEKPRCYCRAIYEAGAWAYDDETRTFVPVPGGDQ